ncbi:hypothetical protein TMatcc_001590 [Talaromyces marneffei ATCC 18224]
MNSISKDFGCWVKENQKIGLNGYGKEDFYVSEDALRVYWEVHRVRDVFSEAGIHRQTPPSPELIIQSYIRIFSILIYIATPDLPSLAYLSVFSASGRNDYNLPLAGDIFPNTEEGRKVQARFLESQFLFSPVVFSPQLHERELDSRHVLPLTFKRQLSGRPGSSTNSAITKLYKLEKASKLQTKEDLVVIKEYPKSEIEHSFKNELKAYMSFHYAGDEPYVSKYFLKYYGSFKQNNKGFIILEYADEGSLLEFFKSNQVPRTREELHGLFENLSDLLYGLRILHAKDLGKTNRQLRGVHQDLKPANIFVSRNENGGTYQYNFKIGDFGLTSFTPTEANEIKNRDNKGGIMYNAPEMTNYDDFSRSLDEGISHLVDIWSFSCVLFEAAVWAISDERGREEFRSLRCKENDQKPRHRDQGYGASFHNGERRLGAIEKTLEQILEQRRFFDDITEGFCKLLLRYAMVPVRGQPSARYDANELGAVIKEYLENAKTPQQSGVTSSPVGRTSLPELNHNYNHYLPSHPRDSLELISGKYNISMDRAFLGGNKSLQRSFNHDMRINETYGLKNPRSSGDFPERSYLDNRPYFEYHKSLPSPIYGEQFPSNGNNLTADPEKEVSKNGEKTKSFVTELSKQTPSDKQIEYPKFGIQDVIRWIDGGRYQSDRLYKGLSSALETLKKRQQIFIIDDTAVMKRDHWQSVVSTFRALAHLTNKVDPDGIELYFRSSPDQPKKPPKLSLWNGRTGAEKLVDKVVSQGKKQEEAICYMQSSIGKILNQVKEKISHKNSETSIYILTDGIWDDAIDSRNICGVDNAILSLVREMCRLNRGESHISIQFIRFGDSEVGKSRLKYLDDDLTKEFKEFKSYDIVDTTTDRSPVWKMLLGSIIGTVDNAIDDRPGDVSG